MIFSASVSSFFFNNTATTEIYTVSDTLSLHDALPISCTAPTTAARTGVNSAPHTRRSEEHTSELQSPDTISYAVFCLKKKIATLKRCSRLVVCSREAVSQRVFQV